MKKARDLKQMARNALQGHYGTVCGGVLITYLVSFALCIPLLALTMFRAQYALNGNLHYRYGFGTGTALSSVMMVLIYLISAVAGGLLSVGIRRICYQVCDGGPVQISDLLFGLTHHPLRHLGVIVLQGLAGMCCYIPYMLLSLVGALLIGTGSKGTAGMSLAGILLIAAGIILGVLLGIFVALRFSLAGIILVEDPERTVLDSMRASWQLLQGNIWRYVRIYISFLGVALLGIVSFYLGFLWIIPYVSCTTIFFYMERKQETEGGGYRRTNLYETSDSYEAADPYETADPYEETDPYGRSGLYNRSDLSDLSELYRRPGQDDSSGHSDN